MKEFNLYTTVNTSKSTFVDLTMPTGDTIEARLVATPNGGSEAVVSGGISSIASNGIGITTPTGLATVNGSPVELRIEISVDSGDYYTIATGQLIIPKNPPSNPATFTTADETKLDGIAPGATANATNAELRDRATHTGAQAISTVTGLQDELNDKAAVSHSHVVADVTDFDTEVSANTDVAANTAARHTHANLAVLDATTASFLTSDETKLDGIAAGATVNDTDANLKNRANHTGTQTASTISDLTETVQDVVASTVAEGTGIEVVYDDILNTLTISSTASGGLDAEAVRDTIATALVEADGIDITIDDVLDTITIGISSISADKITDGTTNHTFTAADDTKLAGIASGATANDTDANLKARANHTGTQAASTISDFSTAADARVTAAIGVSVQAYDADLDSFAGKAAPSGDVVGTSDSQVLTNKTIDGDLNTLLDISADSVIDGTTNHVFTAADDTKLTGIASGATANSSDATLLARANHTGTQAASTISDFSTAADARVAAAIGVSVQAYDADLDAWSGKTAPSGTVVGHNDAQTLTNKTISAVSNTITISPSNISGVSGVEAAEINYLDGVTSSIQTQLNSKSDELLTIVTATGTTRTAALTDLLALVTRSNVSASTETVPLNATVSLPVGFSYKIFNLGAGTVTLAASSSVTLTVDGGSITGSTPTGTPKLKVTTGKGAELIKIATDSWIAVGGLEA